MYNIITQITGIIGIILCILCYQFKKHEHLLITKLLADVFWCVHYLMLGGATAAFATNAICAVRETVYLTEKNEKRRYLWIILFVAANWFSLIFTWNGVFSLIPSISITIASYSFWQKSVKVTRILALVIALLQITYAICVHSYPGIINEVLTIAAVSFSLLRQKKTERKANA